MNLTADTLRVLALATVFLAIATAMYVVASAPSRVASRLGMRGLKRQRALAENDLWAQVEPFVRWLGVRVSGVVDDEWRKKLDRHLALAGEPLGLTPEEYVALSVISLVGGMAFGFLFGWLSDMGPILVLVVGPVGAAIPYFQISAEGERRMKEINRGLPYAIDLLALSMSAGQDFPGAVRQVVEKSSDERDAITEEFSRVLQELNIGITRKQALINFEERIPLDAVKTFVGAIVQAEERGNPVVNALRIQASESRRRRTERAEKAAAKAAVQMVGPLFLVFFCIMLLVMGPMMLKLYEQSN
jgi:tight adherence protein C